MKFVPVRRAGRSLVPAATAGEAIIELARGHYRWRPSPIDPGRETLLPQQGSIGLREFVHSVGTS